MRAVVIRRHGGVDCLDLTEVDEPAAAGRAIVRVRAVALNHLDLWLRRGVEGHTFTLPMIPGSEVSGVVEFVPPGSTGWKAGDEVIVAPGISCGFCEACNSDNDPLCRSYGILGETENGGCAEKISVPVRNLLKKPAFLSFAEAAAIPLDFVTAWHMLVRRARLQSGESVLIQAGGSGVGSAALQIARLHHAGVIITTVGSPEKVEQARSLGADHVIQYRDTDFVREVRQITNKQGVDVVVEHVGGDTFEGSLRALARGGRVVTCGATSGAEVKVNLRLIFFKLLSILGSTMGSLSELHEIMKEVEAGHLHPVVDRVLPLAAVAEAHRLLEERRLFGKVVLEV